MSTFYAAFPDSIQAQMMVQHLLADGVAFDDISLVAKDGAPVSPDDLPSTGDASFFVGRRDDPEHDLVDQSSPGADFEAAEISNVGAGISSADSGMNVESVDQMDDSQSEAEDMTWPREDASYASHEMDDLNRAVRTGFPTPVTPLDNVEDRESERDRALEPVVVPGMGVVMGGGDLATAAFDWTAKDGKTDPSGLLVYLQDEGVPPAAANELTARFFDGGAILGVALLPEIDENALDSIAQDYGAVTTGWFGAPRY
jgi:hypothetical protein